MGALTGSTILVTGASGYIGRATVKAARARGHSVKALVRNAETAPPNWAEDPEIEILVADLAQGSLAGALEGANAVIHTAAAISGDAQTMERDTVLATRSLVDALPSPTPRFVLAGSIAVYDYEKLRPGEELDETGEIVSRPETRDAYCVTKLAQETILRDWAIENNAELHILRIGLVFGPERMWNAHLGVALGPLVLRTGGDGELPLSHVENTAQALVIAAETPTEDAVQITNVVDDERPSRQRYLEHLNRPAIPLSWRIPNAVGRLLAPLHLKLPGLLRPASLRARMMPLRYSNARLHALGWTPVNRFADTVRTGGKDG